MNIKFAGMTPSFAGMNQAKQAKQNASAHQAQANNKAQDSFVKAKANDAKSNVQFGRSCCG